MCRRDRLQSLPAAEWSCKQWRRYRFRPEMVSDRHLFRIPAVSAQVSLVTWAHPREFAVEISMLMDGIELSWLSWVWWKWINHRKRSNWWMNAGERSRVIFFFSAGWILPDGVTRWQCRFSLNLSNMKEKHIRHYFRLQLEIRLRLQPRLPHLLLHKLEFNLNHVILQPNHLADLKKNKQKINWNHQWKLADWMERWFQINEMGWAAATDVHGGQFLICGNLPRSVLICGNLPRSGPAPSCANGPYKHSTTERITNHRRLTRWTASIDGENPARQKRGALSEWKLKMATLDSSSPAFPVSRHRCRWPSRRGPIGR